jgi:hypothetical protein
LVEHESGRILPPAELLQQANEHTAAANALQAKLEEIGEEFADAYRWRNRLLFAGIALLIIARVWAGQLAG